ncbi:unnamed protein product [Dracunculus medinensis]|uniref:Solute carrier family 40 member n=1 Tax=Dracunculus medinensis TaxID=318479 RepID=A0A0N4UBM0_DRAME|nr:unnamed protein product [Dracunculus medinensis]
MLSLWLNEGDRLWSFAIILIMEHIGGIRLVSIDQLVEEIIIMILNEKYFIGMLILLTINNLSLIISASTLAICILIKETEMQQPFKIISTAYSLKYFFYIICLILAILTCSMSCLASGMQKNILTKDWIVVLAQKDNLPLSETNATMKTIDLSSSVISPFIAGLIINKIGYLIACFIFIIYNLFDENELFLSVKKSLAMNKWGLKTIRRNFVLYRRQPIFSAAFGLTLLYMTVLGFDGIAVGYGKSQGLPEMWLGILRSIGSIFGILGAIVYVALENFIGVRRTGLIGFLAQQFALYICILSIWLPGSPFDPVKYFRDITANIWWEKFKNSFKISYNQNGFNQSSTISTWLLPSNKNIEWSSWTVNGHSIISVSTLLIGIAISRFGLYMVDLSVTQIMQEKIPERHRGTVFGVQESIAHFFSVIKDLLVIILPDPMIFGLLIILSVTFVVSGALSYVQ